MPVDRATRRAWVIWIIAVAVYLAAVFHRASLGVAGIAASERFDVGPAALGVFTVLQVGVYAAMQVPTGLLVDRFGPRRTLTVAALLMGVGQVLFAVAASYPLGLAARAVLGAGDALTFVSLLRLIAGHFPAHRYPLLVSLTAALGAAGNLVATVPLTVLLDQAGWTTTFLLAGALTAAYAGLTAVWVRDRPAGVAAAAVQPMAPRLVLRRVRDAWRVPGTRLGFWVHFSTMFAPLLLGLLWGFPYLVQAQGLTERAASWLLTLLVLGTLLGGPVVGAVTGRRPECRMALVIAYLALAGVLWAVILAWPGGRVPLGVLVTVFAVLSLGGPASSISFALARDYNPLPRVGTATGVVNVGGFVAVTVTALAVGLALELAGSLPAELSYRFALLPVLAMLLLGFWRTAVWWRRARAALFAARARGERVPVDLHPRRWDAPVQQRRHHARHLGSSSSTYATEAPQVARRGA